jgi:phospholipid-binding lipoprotein MlaA
MGENDFPMTRHLFGFHKSRNSALTVAVFFLTAGLSAPLAADQLTLGGDGGRLTETGLTVGEGYVAPGFVIDGPPVTVASVPAPAASAVQVAEKSASSTPVAAAETAETPPALPVIERVGTVDSALVIEKSEAPAMAGTAVVAQFAAAQPEEAEAAKPATPLAMSRQLAELLAQASESDANDPLEPLNRVIFEINYFLERLLLRPAAELYVLMLPQEARDGIRNFLRNIRTPIVLANDLLQGEGERAWQTTQRFVINSTVGVGGVIDAADRFGIKHHNEDLGQTFAVWGVDEIVYLVLPIFGPSNPRDAVGEFLDRYFDPVWYWTENTDRGEIQIARSVVGGVDSYSRVMDELKKLKDTSVDYYAAIRSIYRQKREADIRNGESKDVPLPDIQYDFKADVGVN